MMRKIVMWRPTVMGIPSIVYDCQDLGSVLLLLSRFVMLRDCVFLFLLQMLKQFEETKKPKRKVCRLCSVCMEAYIGLFSLLSSHLIILFIMSFFKKIIIAFYHTIVRFLARHNHDDNIIIIHDVIVPLHVRWTCTEDDRFYHSCKEIDHQSERIQNNKRICYQTCTKLNQSRLLRLRCRGNFRECTERKKGGREQRNWKEKEKTA